AHDVGGGHLIAVQVLGVLRVGAARTVAQTAPEGVGVLDGHQGGEGQPLPARLTERLADQRRPDATTGRTPGHGQVVQIQAVRPRGDAEVAVQRRHLADPRVVGEQVGAHALIVHGHPGVPRRAGAAGADDGFGFQQVATVGFALDGQDGGNVLFLHQTDGKHRQTRRRLRRLGTTARPKKPTFYRRPPSFVPGCDNESDILSRLTIDGGRPRASSPNPHVGVALILLSGFMLASHDALSKQLALLYSVFLIVWVRNLTQLVVMTLGFAPRMGLNLMRTRRPVLQVARAMSQVGISVFLLIGLRYIPLGEATAVMFLSPLFVTLFSVLVLKERVSGGQWASVLLGFVGVLIIVRPGGELFTPAILLPLAASLCLSGYQLLTRRLNGTDHPITTN